MKHFFIGDALHFGWQTFKNNWKFLLLFDLFLVVLYTLPGFLTSLIPSNLSIVGTILTILFYILNLIVALGTIKIALALAENRPVGFHLLISDIRLLVFYLIGSLVVAVATILGFVLFIIPGVILSIRLQFWPYFILEKKLNPLDALKESWAATRGYGWDLVGFGAVLLVLNLLGVVFLFLGLLITFPVSFVATAYLYKKLVNV